MKKNFLSFLVMPLMVIGLALTLALPVSAGNKHGDKDKKEAKKKTTKIASDIEAVRAAFDAVLSISARAVTERGAVGELSAYFDADVSIIDNSGLTKGWAEYRSRLLDAQLNTVSVSEQQPTNHRVADVAVSVNGDTAWVTYKYKLNAEVNGKSLPIFGYGTTVMVRHSDGWKIVHTQNAGRVERSYDPKF